jgi:catalase
MTANDKPASTFKYGEQPVYTASNGCPVAHPEEYQRVGQNGPLLLQDFHLIDLLAHFDRERIPERVVHAKGAGAYSGMLIVSDPLPAHADGSCRVRGYT